MDPIFAVYCFSHPNRVLVYSVMGALGGALGSLVPYAIGYKGGEPLLAKRIGPERFAKIHNNTEKYGDLALIVPAILPPPTPFKLFVFSAGVARMRVAHFLLAVFAGRLIRFLTLGALTVRYGPEIVGLFQNAVKHHARQTLAILAAIAALCLFRYLRKKVRRPQNAASTVA
ncbi:MAG TPA: VTT domain-containing protein [candidate division Zixibacteria bacterium]|nr:VTT domain-containing protein [candidate division Zixibacteria bacterium]